MPSKAIGIHIEYNCVTRIFVVDVLTCIHEKCVNAFLKVHVVTAFEKSLANMTQRLQKLATASEQKVGGCYC